MSIGNEVSFIERAIVIKRMDHGPLEVLAGQKNTTFTVRMRQQTPIVRIQTEIESTVRMNSVNCLSVMANQSPGASQDQQGQSQGSPLYCSYLQTGNVGYH